MPHRHPQPFWREFMRCWYVQIGGKQIKLHPDREEAFRLYYNLMDRRAKAPAMESPAANLLVVEIIDLFLEWAVKNRERPTYEAYKRRLQALVDAIPASLPCDQLKPFHITRVMNAKDWNANTKNDFASAVQRAFNWAVKQGLLDRNPVAHVEKPAREARELAVSRDDYAEVMEKISEPNFRLLLELAWETGARVQEFRKIEARFFDEANNRLVFPPKDAKGRKYHRVIYLTDRAREIVASQCAKHRTGPILRNSEGKPWNKDSINCAFCRLKNKMGRKLHLGAWRKGYATEALKAGIDTMTVAHLMGHRDGTMVSRIYGRVQQDPAHMADAARRAKRTGHGQEDSSGSRRPINSTPKPQSDASSDECANI